MIRVPIYPVGRKKFGKTCKDCVNLIEQLKGAVSKVGYIKYRSLEIDPNIIQSYSKSWDKLSTKVKTVEVDL